MNEIKPIDRTSQISVASEITHESVAENWLAAHSKKTMQLYADSLKSMAKEFQCSTGEIVKHILSSKAQASLMAVQWKQRMILNGAASATVNVRLSAIKSLVEYANTIGVVDWKLSVKGLKLKPVRDVIGPGVEGIKLMLTWAGSQSNPLKARRDVAILWLLFSCALRRNEVTTLDVRHFDGNRLYALRKGYTQRQWVPVPKRAQEALKAWLFGLQPEDPMFPHIKFNGKLGRRITGRGLAWVVNSIGKGALGRRVRPHGIRHTAITTALDVFNGDCRKVMKFSGHQSISMVMRYDDERRNESSEVASGIEEMLK